MEVSAVVLKALAAEFGDRVLDADTARHGLAHAGFTLIEMHLREVSANGAQAALVPTAVADPRGTAGHPDARVWKRARCRSADRLTVLTVPDLPPPDSIAEGIARR